MKTAAVFALAMLTTACGEDLAERDYTDTACPAPVDDDPVTATWVCDRGRGQSPRYVPVAACMEEVRVRATVSGFGLNSTSPNYQRCRPGVSLFTIDDVRRGDGLVAY